MTDHRVLAAVFAARVKLAKETKDQATANAAEEWEATQKWVKSVSTKEGSFLWFCDEFELDPAVVRREIFK